MVIKNADKSAPTKITMPTKTNEESFEALIEKSLIQESGYFQGESQDYNKDYCLDTLQLFNFLEETQADTLAEYKKKRGENYKELLCKRIYQQIQQKGIVELLRKGISDQELKFQLLYKQPTSDKNPQSISRYQQNRYSVTRQLYYSDKNRNSLDMVIFINGLPLITFELKNHWTNQTVEEAKKQYKKDRDPKEPLFQLARCLVHFAVDTNEVYMTTYLNGQKTVFLPFNKGHANGKGNPLNPDGIKTDYLWKSILTKTSLSNIIENYAQFLKKEKKLIFPRYHQLNAVIKILAHAKANGTGQKYLIQHSAGSGKSNSLTWLAHQLVELHSSDDKVIFNSVIVVTDRRVLDKQIRDNIKQFAQVNNVVEAITQGSQQLKSALENGKKIIITTIQKFPFVVEEIAELKGSRFAIIIDEAHSSQTGETAGKMNTTLSSEFDSEDEVIKAMESKKLPKNISYFAFTATPKNKTLELFGTKTSEGKREPFHLYSMKQAIQEEFILDVLKNYTTYKSYYKLLQTAENNPVFDTSKAKKKIKAYVEGHEFTIAKKTAVMVDDFMTKTKDINGKAKAMVVTSSIINAIKYKQAFDEYLKKIHSPYKSIIAFSGKKEFKGDGYTETGINGFDSGKIPEKLKETEYRFLIVAEKFQTGFDEPLLHSMYVDKPLKGVQAVQTLSRLNRAYKPYKSDTFVLDFVNTTKEIKEAFDPYYECILLSEDTDPNKLNDLEEALADFQVYEKQEAQDFTANYFAKKDREELEKNIDSHVALFNELETDEQVGFKVKASSFVKTYAFLALIIPFNKKYWEELYWFLKFLIPKLKLKVNNESIEGLLDSIDLDSYTQHRQALNQDIILDNGVTEIDPITPQMRGSKAEPEKEFLQEIIAEFNKKWGETEFGKNDLVTKILFEDLTSKIAINEEYIRATKFSDVQNSKITFDKMMEDKIQGLVFDYTDLYKEFEENKAFKNDILGMMFKVVMDKQNIGIRV